MSHGESKITKIAGKRGSSARDQVIKIPSNISSCRPVAEHDPGEWESVCELVGKEKMDKVDVADLQCGSLIIPMV